MNTVITNGQCASLIVANERMKYYDMVCIYSRIRDLFVRTFSFVIVYLEQYRDICNLPAGRQVPIESEFFEEQIKSLLSVRQKTLYLQRSWRKFIVEKR